MAHTLIVHIGLSPNVSAIMQLTFELRVTIAPMMWNRIAPFAPLAVLALAACGDNIGATCSLSWEQWGSTAGHDGAACAVGQTLGSALADIAYDPFIVGEENDAGGDLVIHYQTPLIDGDDLFMLVKSGTYTPCPVGSDGVSQCGAAYGSDGTVQVSYRLNSQIWTEHAFRWAADGTLQSRWSYASDWKPEPETGFEQMFQPAIDGDVVIVPGAGGAVWEVSRDDGSVVRHDQPFGSAIDPDTYVAGGIAVAPDGTIYYNALKMDHNDPFDNPAQGWLVSVSPSGETTTATYPSLIPGSPGDDDACYYTYFSSTNPPPLPWPPPAGSNGPVLPPQYACGAQQPGINSTPAIARDGTIYIVSHAHFQENYSYIAAVHPDLTPKWATSLRGLLHDGCGVTIPDDATATMNTSDCAPGAPMGVDPTTGMAPAAMVDDDSSSSPVAVPDGVLYGSLTAYNADRGHTLKFDTDGNYLTNFDFGWDDTPAIYTTPVGYRVITKDNHYNFDANGLDHGPFYITELDDNLSPVWKFQSTNTQSCTSGSDGSVQCVSDHPDGFEWCINAPAVDRDGNVYGNSEDGNAYAIGSDGSLRETFFLNKALGAAYTPIAIDQIGRVFALNNGHLTAIGAAQ